MLIGLGSLTTSIAATGIAQPDTTLPPSKNRRPVQMTLPGYRLDTSFSQLERPDPAVYKVVPNWLRAKAAGKPIYVLNGLVATPKQLQHLKSSAVESVQVINGQRAAALYGSVAHTGVVAITTKAALPPK